MFLFWIIQPGWWLSLNDTPCDGNVNRRKITTIFMIKHKNVPFLLCSLQGRRQQWKGSPCSHKISKGSATLLVNLPASLRKVTQRKVKVKLKVKVEMRISPTLWTKRWWNHARMRWRYRVRWGYYKHSLCINKLTSSIVTRSSLQ